MREKHELERGIICEKCLKIASKKDYIRSSFNKPIIGDSTGATKVISRMNLCSECYEELKGLLETFTGRDFIEKEDNISKKEKLEKIRDEIIGNKIKQDEIKENRKSR